MDNNTKWKFCFNAALPLEGFSTVFPDTRYSDELGYGFDFETNPYIGNKAGTFDNNTNDNHAAFYFSVRVPEGNYDVWITLGNKDYSSTTTVRAETRRLMLDKVKTNTGEFVTKCFTVNVKNIRQKENIKLNDRELNKLNWDNKLTLEFNGSRPCFNKLEISRTDSALTLFMAGDSTLVDQDDEPYASWGQMITRYFKKGLAIANHAESGLSLLAFISENRFNRVLNLMRAGDFLVIQFGHIDKKDKSPDSLELYAIRILYIVQEVKKIGGIPVLATPLSRRYFEPDGSLINTLSDFPDAVRQIAEEEKIILLDVNEISRVFFEALGIENSKNAFVYYPKGTWPGQLEAFEDNAHLNGYGAYQLALYIANEIKKVNPAFATFLTDDLPEATPAKPSAFKNFYLPLSPLSPVAQALVK